MFVNYFADDRRDTPVNRAVARFIIGGWLCWKTAMYDWRLFLEAPTMQTSAFAWAIPPVAPGLILELERLLLLGLLVGFMAGYRIRLTGFLAAVLVAHLGTVRMTQITSGESESLFIGVYVLLLFALFADEDELSVDGMRRLGRRSAGEIGDRLEENPVHRHGALRWSLVVFALIYFGSGFDKVFHDGLTRPSLSFAAPENLARWTVLYRPDGPLQFVTTSPVLMRLGAVGALGLELGFLIAVLAGITVTPFMLGLLVFTASNVLLLGIHFVDVYFLVAAFVAWDGALARLQPDEELLVTYDPDHRRTRVGVAGTAMLDATNAVGFVPAGDPTADQLPPESTLAVRTGESVHHDRDAASVLAQQLRLTAPLASLLSQGGDTATVHDSNVGREKPPQE